MLFQMKRSGEDPSGAAFEWSQPLALSERMTTYRGFFRQRRAGEADTVEVSVSRDEKSGFLRLRLSNCKQERSKVATKWLLRGLGALIRSSFFAVRSPS